MEDPAAKPAAKGKSTINAPYVDFARRIDQACDAMQVIPPKHFGRLAWIAERISNVHGEKISSQTVSKWFKGESLPRRKMMIQLAKLLQVDVEWLTNGTEPALSSRERRVQLAVASGSVNVVAGLIQMQGGSAVLPAEDDELASAMRIDLYAHIRGAQYRLHIATGEQDGDHWSFVVPLEARDCLVIGVMQTGLMSFEFVELDAEGIDAVGKRKGGAVTVSYPNEQHEFRQITSFANRL